MNQFTPPEGYMRDHRGRLIPVSMVKPVDQLRTELVARLIAQAEAMAHTLAEFRSACDSEIGAFVDLSAAEYDVHHGGRRGNLQLVSFDGLFKVQRQVSDRLTFDERLQHAKALIDECLEEWSQGADEKIRLLVQDAFQVDKSGAINVDRVLGLRRIKIDDEKWLRAMQAINDSIQTDSSKSYLRFYKRGSVDDAWTPISLDLATVGGGS